MNEINFEQDATPENANTLPAVNAARQMMKLAGEIVDLEKLTKEKKEQMRMIERDQLPSMLEEMGVSELPLADGYIISIKDIIEANIPSESAISKEKDPEVRQEKIDRRAECHAWLRANNSGAIIKKQLSVDLGKVSDEIVQQVKEAILEAGFNPEQTEAVHNATLKKLLKEKMEKGDDVPFDTFSIFAGKKASIKPPKS